MQWSWLFFGLGAAGGAGPEIIRLYALRTTPNKFRWSTFYVVASLFFIALAGLVAVALPSVTPWGAIYAGVAMPVIVTTAAKKAAKKGQGQKGNGAHRVTMAPASIESFFNAL